MIDLQELRSSCTTCNLQDQVLERDELIQQMVDWFKGIGNMSDFMAHPLFKKAEKNQEPK